MTIGSASLRFVDCQLGRQQFSRQGAEKVCRPPLKPNSGETSSADGAFRIRAVEHDEVGRFADLQPIVIEPQQPGRARSDHVEALADVVRAPTWQMLA